MPSSGTGTPDAQQDEQILNANVAAAVEVGGAISLRRARPPDAQQDEQILNTNVVAAVEIPWARWGFTFVGDAVVVLVATEPVGDVAEVELAVGIAIGKTAEEIDRARKRTSIIILESSYERDAVVDRDCDAE